jgi:hypothetical protein
MGVIEDAASKRDEICVASGDYRFRLVDVGN